MPETDAFGPHKKIAPLTRAAELDRDLREMAHRIASGTASPADRERTWTLIKQRAATMLPPSLAVGAVEPTIDGGASRAPGFEED
jgi:hypothetical protein